MKRVTKQILCRHSWRVVTAAALCGAAVAAAHASAHAHPGHKRSSRMIEVTLAAEPPTLKYGYVFEQSASEAIRKVADEDGDGTVSPLEGVRGLARWGDDVRRQLTLCRGPTLTALKCSNLTAEQLINAHATAWESRPGKPLSLVWEFRFALDPDDRALEVRDASQRAEVDRTDAAIEPAEQGQVSAVNENGSTRRGPLTFSWNEDQPGRVRKLAVVWEPEPPRWMVVVVVGAASLLAAGQLLLVWKRRRLRAAAAARATT